MDIYDERIPADLFAVFTARMPECTVELVVEHDETLLLTKRTNPPAEGEWFWPGTRLYKGERPREAAHRLAEEELGIDVEILEMLGVYSHFWETSALPGAPSRHTVNNVFHARTMTDQPRIELDNQHSEYRFVDELEPGLHDHVRQYVTENELLSASFHG